MKKTKVYRSSLIPVANSGGLQVRATSLNLLSVLNTGVARGAWLNAGTAREPVAVLGAVAAERLGIDRVHADQRIWLGGQWFNVAGILKPSPLATDIDASALVGYLAAQRYLGYVSLVRGEQKAGPPSTIYVRAATGYEAAVRHCSRRPPTAHAIPIWVGAYKPRMLRLTGAAADGWLPSLPYLGSWESIADANAVIDEAASQAGRDPLSVRRLLNLPGRLGTEPTPGLQGSPEQWVDQIATMVLDHGFSAFILTSDDATALARYGQEVAPAVRELIAAERRVRLAPTTPHTGRARRLA